MEDHAWFDDHLVGRADQLEVLSEGEADSKTEVSMDVQAGIPLANQVFGGNICL